MKRCGRNTIRSKVVRKTIVMLLITVAFVAAVDLIFMYRRVLNEQKIEIGIANDLCASTIDGWVLEKKGISEGIAHSLEAINSLDEETIRSMIDLFADNHSELFYVYVATEEGNMYLNGGAPYVKNVDPRERVWYKAAKEQGHTIVSNPYISITRQGVMLVTIATPIYFDSKLVGVVGVDASVDTIQEYIKSIHFKDNAYGFLVDRNGNIIVHKNEEYIPTVEKLTSAEEVIPEIKEILDSPGSKTVIAKDYTNTTMVYSTSKLKECDWLIGMAYPKKNIIRYVRRGININIGAAIISILFAVIYVSHACKKMLKPIEKINPVMDKITEGDFKTKVDFEAGDDEIGEFQQKIAFMNNTLSDIIEKQKYVLGEMEKGNLMVEDIEELPGDLNGISKSVNSIKEAFNDIISDIQFSAINVQSFAMGINESSNLEEMKLVFEQLSAEANALMDKTSRFNTAVRTSESKILSDTLRDDF